MTQELTPEINDRLVVCSDCGATIDRAYAQPFLAMQQEGQVLDMRRRFVCLDRVRCKERGPIAQSAEELRADLEAAQTVIEELKAQLKQTKEELALARQALPTQEAAR